MARCSISPSATLHLQRSHERRSRRSKHSSSAWGGASSGCPRMEAILISTTTFRFPRGEKVYYNFEMTEFPSEEGPGISVFYKNRTGQIFHTYSAYARGTELLVGTYNYLDLVPKGRDEDGLPFTMSWVRHHDRYSDGYLADASRPYWPAITIQAAESARKNQ
jgi:hypothetical protein